MTGLYTDSMVEALRVGVEALAPQWGLSPATRITLLTVSENATFRADDPAREAPLILRVHRPGYHTPAEIASELAWIDALRADHVVTAAAPIPTQSGRYLARFDVDGTDRHVVAFEFMPGTEPAPDDPLKEGFHQLGAISARLHAHARQWPLPKGFARKIWDFDATVGPHAHWGDWHNALGLSPDGAKLLKRAADALRTRLAAYGSGPDRFGLIHADLRLANLLIADGPNETGRISVIDFDDCGFGWFAFDFAAAISFFETAPTIPALQDAWIAGYRTIAPLDHETVTALPTFVMLRRLQLTAWISSHRETPTAREMGADYTAGTLALADRFLQDLR